MIRIRKGSREDKTVLAEIIRTANRVVADQLGLNSENAPTHPSNCRPDWIERDFEKGIIYHILEADEEPAGCVAFEQAGQGVCYLERLAVRPAFQNRGFGKRLVEFFLHEAESLGNQTVSIAIIREHEHLLKWYSRLGFVETSVRQFDHLPFTVQFMEYRL